MTAAWEVGTDIGGTFTDIVAVNAVTHETRTAKVPSRPDAPVDAMLEAIAAVGLQPDELRRFVHGTTRITNAIVQDRLPPIALIATAGFEDVLEIARYRRRDLYRLDIPPKAPPLVPAERCFGLAERMDHQGRVVHGLDPAELDRMVAWVKATGVSSVAVSLLHAYANPAHERHVAERLRGVVPHVSLSHEVNPEAREYERASSTAYNAAAMPIAVEYLAALQERLPLGAGLQVFHSAGGMVPVPTAKKRPIVMAMSGPAAGVAASVRIAQTLGRNRVLTFDMGGTTTDVCLIVDGAAEMADTRMAGDRPLRQPMLAVHSIGAGGGSIVQLTPGGLTVGPQSAGAEPGPACYGQGGTRATVTDANLLLGYLDPALRLGNRITVDPALAARVVTPIAEGLGIGLVQTALGIIQVANATMARALRRVTVERGIDGRDCTLLAFGGGGPMHAAGLADLYGITEVVVPPASSAFSALGCLVADLSFLQQQTVRLPLRSMTADAFTAQVDALTREASAPLAGQSGPVTLEYTALMRYAAQSDAMPVPFAMPFDAATLERDFHARHRQLYGYATDEPPVVESLRVLARVPSGIASPAPARGIPHPPRIRPCSFAGALNVPTAILHRDALDGVVTGPAIIEDAWSTVIVPPGWQARPDEAGYLFLTRPA
jgi:N-methylhydantoinase A